MTVNNDNWLNEILGSLRTRLLRVGEPTNKGYGNRYELRKQYLAEAEQAILYREQRLIDQALLKQLVWHVSDLSYALGFAPNPFIESELKLAQEKLEALQERLGTRAKMEQVVYNSTPTKHVTSDDTVNTSEPEVLLTNELLKEIDVWGPHVDRGDGFTHFKGDDCATYATHAQLDVALRMSSDAVEKLSGEWKR